MKLAPSEKPLSSDLHVGNLVLIKFPVKKSFLSITPEILREVIKNHRRNLMKNEHFVGGATIYNTGLITTPPKSSLLERKIIKKVQFKTDQKIGGKKR